MQGGQPFMRAEDRVFNKLHAERAMFVLDWQVYHEHLRHIHKLIGADPYASHVPLTIGSPLNTPGPL
eukprot:13630803-Alexandrium_andersonii.AAC.1